MQSSVERITDLLEVVGIPKEMNGVDGVEPGVTAAVTKALEVAESLGARVDECSLPRYVDYGVALRSAVTAPDRFHSAAASVLHMHCNRLLGSDHEAESFSYAIARGAVQVDRDRIRFAR